MSDQDQNSSADYPYSLIDGATGTGFDSTFELEKLKSKIRDESIHIEERVEAYEDIVDSEVGDTSLVRARNTEREFVLRQIYMKFEGSNPTGTQKDRIAFAQCMDALRRGFDTLTLATCGNYGVAVALAAGILLRLTAPPVQLLELARAQLAQHGAGRDPPLQLGVEAGQHVAGQAQLGDDLVLAPLDLAQERHRAAPGPGGPGGLQQQVGRLPATLLDTVVEQRQAGQGEDQRRAAGPHVIGPGPGLDLIQPEIRDPEQLVDGGKQPLGEAGLRREEPERVVRAAPRGRVRGLLDLDLLPKGVLVHERIDAVVVPDQDEVAPCAASGCRPPSGLTIPVVPVGDVGSAVPPVVCKARDVLDQAPGEAHLRAGVRQVEDRGDGVPRVPLVVADPVRLPEDLGLVVLGVPEDDQGQTDLNGDGDTSDNVWHVYDARTDTTRNLGRAVLWLVVSDGRDAFRVKLSL